MPAQSAIEHAQRTRSTLAGTESAAHGIARVRYSHDSMIDLLLIAPHMKQYELAAHFGVTAPWISRVLNSDAFLQRLAQRKAEVIDPLIIHNMEEKLAGLVDQSIEIIAEKLEKSRSPDLAVKALELSSKALGYGARKDTVNVQNNFVVALPQKAASAGEWATKYGSNTVDVSTSAEARPVTPDQNPGSDLMRLAGGAPA